MVTFEHITDPWARASGTARATGYTMDQARCTAIVNARKHRCGRSSSVVSLGVIETSRRDSRSVSKWWTFRAKWQANAVSGRTRYRDRQRPPVPCLRSLSHALDQGRPRRVGRLVPVSVRFPTLPFIASPRALCCLSPSYPLHCGGCKSIKFWLGVSPLHRGVKGTSSCDSGWPEWPEGRGHCVSCVCDHYTGKVPHSEAGKLREG
jgi:hypothetical protein